MAGMLETTVKNDLQSFRGFFYMHFLFFRLFKQDMVSTVLVSTTGSISFILALMSVNTVKYFSLELLHMVYGSSGFFVGQLHSLRRSI